MSKPESHWVTSSGKTVGEVGADAVAYPTPDATAPGGTYTTAEQDIIANLQARVVALESKLQALGY